MAQQPLKLIRRNHIPPGGFRYLQGETKVWIRAATFPGLVKAVIAHRQANHLPVGSDVEGEVEQQMCASLGPEWCNNNSPVIPAGRLTFAALLQGTKTLIDWAIHGGRVSKDEADRRATICAKCQFNQDSAGCTGCNAAPLNELVSTFAEREPIPHGRYLKNCLVCQCRLEIKVRVPLEIIQKHTPQEQMDRLPEWCWVKEMKVA